MVGDSQALGQTIKYPIVALSSDLSKSQFFLHSTVSVPNHKAAFFAEALLLAHRVI